MMLLSFALCLPLGLGLVLGLFLGGDRALQVQVVHHAIDQALLRLAAIVASAHSTLAAFLRDLAHLRDLAFLVNHLRITR
jgi:hypothetical protein